MRTAEIGQLDWCCGPAQSPGSLTDAGLRSALAPPPILADLDVRLGPVPARLPNPTGGGLLWEADGRQFLLRVPGAARILASAGRELTVQAEPGADERAIVRIVRMTPLAVIAWQRGLLAFHAAAAIAPQVDPADSAPRQAVLLCGDSAAGKSTLLAALLARGWEMLADELAIVSIGADRVAQVHPSPPELTLWPKAIERLLPAGLTDPAATPGPRAFVVRTGEPRAPVRLAAAWQLATHYGDTEVAPLASGDRFAALAKYTYNTRVATTMLDASAQLRRLAALASVIRVGSLTRPRRRWSVEALAEAVCGMPPDA